MMNIDLAPPEHHPLEEGLRPLLQALIEWGSEPPEHHPLEEGLRREETLQLQR